LQEELLARFNNIRAIDFAIYQMVRMEELQQVEHKKMLLRKK